jgi:hypothetical protein
MAGYADNVDQFQQDLAEDHRNRVLGKEPRYISFVKPTGDEVKQSFLDQLNEEELRNYKGKLTLQSYQATTLTDVTPLVALIAPRPVCFILADQDFLPGQMEAYDATREPKTLVEIEGHHFSPYMEQKTRAIEVAREFFQAHFRES